MSLEALIDEPFKLLLAIEQRARDAVARRQGANAAVEEWIGVAFRLGNERFVTARADVREVLPLPEQQTRVPGAKPWLRGIADVRGQLLTIVDLKAFLGAGPMHADRKARMLMLASREVPTSVIVDEVLGFRRFATADFSEESPATEVRCEHYLAGSFGREAERFPLFDMQRLLKDRVSLAAGLERGLLDGVSLQKAIKLLRIAPAAFEVVVVDRGGVGVADQRVPPLRQLHNPALAGAAVQPAGAVHGCPQRQPSAGREDGLYIPDLRLDRDDV